jgi:catechol 2,3-dioxygenase-like lactoylglutathione lyase family enzyme
MTSIRGYVDPTRRPGELGVHSMDHFSLIVPDLKIAQGFYTSFGLDVREEGDTLGIYTHGTDHRWAAISEGSRKRLASLSFGVFEDDFDRFKRHIESQGQKLTGPPPGIDSNGLWLHDHNGLLIELRVAEKTSPDSKSPSDNRSSPPGVAAAPARSAAAFVRPERMAHVLAFTVDVQQAIDFYHRVLGLRMSDRSGEGICFMHGIHGSDHHLIAFAKSSAPGLHHCSWDVGSIDAIGRGAMQMADRGFSQGWGLGRHVLGSNYFHYVRDPWGSYCEYSSDIDFIPANCDWKGGDHPPDDSFYLWGPEPPVDFAENHEVSSASGTKCTYMMPSF